MSTQGQGDVVARPWFCDVTGNPVGTDTRIIGEPDCDCQGCRADREITRLRALLSSSRGEQGWRTIDSAPEDGTWFLICRDDEGPESYEVGCFDPQIWKSYEPAENGLYRQVEKVVNEWRGFNNFHRATHWMPLPSAPGSVPTSLAGQGTDTCTCDEFQSCPRCHTANLDPDWLEKELAEVATQPTAGGDAPTFDTPKSEPNLEPSNVFSNALSAERARVIEPLQKIIERSENGELGTSKVRDMANIAKAALRALSQQDTGGADHG